MEEPRLPTMRAADVDRERVLEIVRQSHAEGRLSTTEFYDRLEAVYQAKTFADLDVVTADLPTWTTPPHVVPPPRAVARPAPARPVSTFASLPAELRNLWIVWGTAVAINLVIWLAVSLGSGDLQYFWPIWVAGPWGVVNLGITLSWWFNARNDPDPPHLPPGAGPVA